MDKDTSFEELKGLSYKEGNSENYGKSIKRSKMRQPVAFCGHRWETKAFQTEFKLHVTRRRCSRDTLRVSRLYFTMSPCSPVIKSGFPLHISVIERSSWRRRNNRIRLDDESTGRCRRLDNEIQEQNGRYGDNAANHRGRDRVIKPNYVHGRHRRFQNTRFRNIIILKNL